MTEQVSDIDKLQTMLSEQFSGLKKQMKSLTDVQFPDMLNALKSKVDIDQIERLWAEL